MPSLNVETITVTGAVTFLTLTSLSVKEKINEHSTAELTGYISDDIGFSQLNKKLHGSDVTVTYEPTGEVLFSGIVDDFNIFKENDIYIGNLKLISHTFLLDQVYHSRSFQDISMSYETMIQAVLDDSSVGSFISSVDELSSTIPYPIIQYHETDWEFIKRVSSHFEASLFPHFKYGKSQFYIGLPESQKSFDFGINFYGSGISERFYELGGYESGYAQTDFKYYEIHSKENLFIGDTSTVDGKSLRVCEKTSVFNNFEVIFKYIVAGDSYPKSKSIYNEIFSGLSLLGTVIETDKETLKIHLAIDETQDVATAYPYNWTPPTGNLMYLMPQVGTQVSLYFYNQCESSARSVNCVRTNGDSPMMGNCEERRLLTEHGKQMHLYPESLGFTSAREGTPLTMMFDDTEGVVFSSHNKLDITALESIMIDAPTVVMSALTNMQAIKGNVQLTGGGENIPYNVIVDPISTIDMFNMTQAQSNSVKYTAWVFYSYPPFDDAPTKAKVNWKLVGKVIAAVAVVVIVTAAIVVTAGGAALAIPALTTVATLGAAPTLTTGGMIIVGAIGVGAGGAGLNAVSNMAHDEYYNANQHSLGDYLYTAMEVTYKVGSMLSLPLNIWSLRYTLPKTIKSIKDIAKALKDGTKFTAPSITWEPSPNGNGTAVLVPKFSGGISLPVAIPQLVVSADTVTSALGVAGSIVAIASNGGGGNSSSNDYYKEGLEEVPDDWVEVEVEEAPVKSEEFKEFLRSKGHKPKGWRKVMEKWASPDGTIYQRHYWTNGTDYFYHGSSGIIEFFPH